MTYDEVKALQKEWNAMLDEVDFKLGQVKNILRKKYGLEGNFSYNSKEYTKYADELNKVESRILKQYPFYTGYEEELYGADLVFKFLLNKVKG